MIPLSSSVISDCIDRAPNTQPEEFQNVHSVFTPSYGSSAAIGMALTQLNSNNNSWNAVFLVASTDDLPSTRLVISQAYTGSGYYGDGQGTGAGWNIYSQYSLTETNKDETNPRNLTKVYNQYYFGNDNEKSNAFVYNVLQRLYGAQYKSFIYYKTGGTSRGLFPAYGRNGVMTALYPQSSEPNTLGLYKLDYPAADVDDGWNCAGTILADPQYTIDTDNKIIAAAIFGEYEPSKLQFDVYIDGTRDANVSIRWNADVDETFSLQLVTPRVWTLPDSQPSYPYINDGGILVPNEANPRMRKYVYTWVGQYDAPYLNEFNNCTSDLDAFTKTTIYGASGIATRMRYLLRFNKQKNENNVGVMTWGNCYIVDVPREVNSLADINVTTLDPSKNNPEFSDSVVLHLGPPPDDIPDDDDDYPDGQDFDGNPDGVYEDDDIHDFDTGKPTGFSGKALLTKTYAMTSLRTENLGSKLWTQSYFDVLKIQNNPIENVVAMKWFPFSVSGTDTEIKIGNVLMGTNGEVVDSIYKFTVGSAYYRSKNSKASFLDCSPYTQIKLHLPYCGIIQLDASEMLNRKITVSYVVDLVSGDCMAFIELDGTALGEKRIPFMSVSGHIGVDIPLTASNRIQAEMRAASTAISAVSGAAAHVIGGDVVGGAVQAAQGALSVAGMDYTTQRTAAHSPACMTHENRTVFLEIWRPAYDEEISTNNGFKSRHGFPTYKYKTIGSLSGFVKCDARTKIDFAMTGRENQMLEELLTSGVYV